MVTLMVALLFGPRCWYRMGMRYILIACCASIIAAMVPSYTFGDDPNPAKCQELYPSTQTGGYNGNCNYGYSLGEQGKDASECYVSNQEVQKACLAGWQAGRTASGNDESQDDANTPNTPQNPTEPGAVPSSTQGNSCGRVKTSYVKCNTSNDPQKTEETTIWQTVIIIMNVLLGVVGVVAIGGVVYGAMLYGSAGDNATQTQQGKETIRNVLIGLILYLFLWSAAQALIPGGVF